jgi:hypothetical protein
LPVFLPFILRLFFLPSLYSLFLSLCPSSPLHFLLWHTYWQKRNRILTIQYRKHLMPNN